MLECVECHATNADMRPEVEHHQLSRVELGWLTFSVADPDLESGRFTVTYCTKCLLREFGGVLCQTSAAPSG